MRRIYFSREAQENRFGRFLLGQILGTLLILSLGLAANRLMAAENGAFQAKTLGEISLENGGVLYTFDDVGNIANWVRQIPLFQKYGVKATFFINAPESVDAEGWENLRKLQEIGGAIGFHGIRHWKAVEKVQELGGEEYLAQEITPGLALMEERGFHPTAFGYPSSQRNDETDRLFEPFFNHLRTGKGLPTGVCLADDDDFFTPVAELSHRFCLIGKGTDRADEAFLEEQIYPALIRAKERSEILVLYAHNIAEESSSHFIRPEILEKIFQKGAELGIPFYSYDQLPPYEKAEADAK